MRKKKPTKKAKKNRVGKSPQPGQQPPPRIAEGPLLLRMLPGHCPGDPPLPRKLQNMELKWDNLPEGLEKAVARFLRTLLTGGDPIGHCRVLVLIGGEDSPKIPVSLFRAEFGEGGIKKIQKIF